MPSLSTVLAILLVLLATALLFTKQHRGKKNWPLLIGFSFVITALVILSWSWQYSKLESGTSILSLLGQKYGAIALAAIELGLFAGLIVAVWKDWASDEA